MSDKLGRPLPIAFTKEGAPSGSARRPSPAINMVLNDFGNLITRI